MPTTTLSGKLKITYNYGREADKRRRDLMNYEKPLTDFLVKNGVMHDDSQIEHAELRWDDSVPAGMVDITVQQMEG